ncbi:MAG: methyl-accepting chemotaxis protein, partial [Desulfobacterales bacterium]
MAASFSVGSRLRLGFALAALIPVALSAFTYHGARQNDLTVEELVFRRVPALESLFLVKEQAEFAQAALRTLAIAGLPPEMRKRQFDNLRACRAKMKEAISAYQGLSRTPEEEERWQAFLSAWHAWDGEVGQALEAALRIEERVQAYEKSDRSRRTSYLEALGALKEAALLAAVSFKTQVQEWKNILISGNDPEQFRRRLTLFEQEEQAVRRTLEDAAQLVAELGLDPEPVRRTLDQHAEAGAKYREGLRQFDTGDPETGKKVDRLVRGADRGPTLAMLQLNEMIDQVRLQAEGLYGNLRQRLLGPVTETRRAANAALEPLLKSIRENAAAAGVEAEALANRLRWAAVAAGSAGLGLAVILGFWLTRSITGALRRVIAGLSEGAEEVASAAGQVSGAAQSLAEGSSEQAASIEETSSSLEEMSSMTRRNADNAKEANRLMGEARQVVSAANEQMGRLTESMGEITRASEETSKII